MNLNKLFEMQKQLDEKIVKVKGLEWQDLLPMKILALQVELGELANEWRGFKFWSENQDPKTKAYRQCPQCKGIGWRVSADIGPVITGTTTVQCNSCVNGRVEYNPMLEEYVDSLHFILSIGNDLIHRTDATIIEIGKDGYKKQETIVGQFNLLFSVLGELWDHGELDEPYNQYIGSFIDLGFMLGFTWEQIERAYEDKHAVNMQRQENGY